MLYYTGNLHFANIEVEDGLSDRRSHYVCVSQNKFIRSLQQGEDQRIIPKQQQGSCLRPKNAACRLACCCAELWPWNHGRCMLICSNQSWLSTDFCLIMKRAFLPHPEVVPWFCTFCYFLWLNSIDKGLMNQNVWSHLGIDVDLLLIGANLLLLWILKLLMLLTSTLSC